MPEQSSAFVCIAISGVIVFFLIVLVAIIVRIEKAKAAESALREKARTRLRDEILTSQTASVHGKRVVKQLGAVFSKWSALDPAVFSPTGDWHALPRALFLETGDHIPYHELVDLTLRSKAKELGANAIVNLRIRTFKNGAEGSGDAVVLSS